VSVVAISVDELALRGLDDRLYRAIVSMTRRATRTSFASLDGRDLVAAFVIGGFRIARRERGLALLVRELDAVVVPELRVLDEARVRALIARAHVSEEEIATWLAARNATSTKPTALESGFRPRVDGGRRSIEDVVRHARDAGARADALNVGADTAREALRAALEDLETRTLPDEERARATRAALDRWSEALRELDLDGAGDEKLDRKR
jgi:hypothetical protein